MRSSKEAAEIAKILRENGFEVLAGAWGTSSINLANASASAYAQAVDPPRVLYDARLNVPNSPKIHYINELSLDLCSEIVSNSSGELLRCSRVSLDALECIQGALIYNDAAWVNIHTRTLIQVDDYIIRYFLEINSYIQKMQNLMVGIKKKKK